MNGLRPYQKEAVDAVYAHLSDRPTNPCVVVPTAGGKSWILGTVASDVASKWGGRVLVLAHVKELLEQNADKLRRICPGLDIGIYSAGLGKREAAAPVVVAGIQSVYNKADALGRFALVIVDEAHLIPPDGDGMYRTLLSALKAANSKLRIVGFTATPYRLHGGLLCQEGNILEEVCYEVGVRRLIDEGWISRVSAKAGRMNADLAHLHVRAGEFIQEEVEKAVDTASAVDTAAHDLVARTKDRKSIIVFCASVKHCVHVAEKLRALDPAARAEVVTGDTPSVERARILREFRGDVQKDLFGNSERPVKYLVNMGVLTTGFDAPNIDCVALLRPTKSAALYVQMVGRGFRLSPETGKTDCLVLDYGGNIVRHGPVDAVTVHDRRPGQTREEPLAKECPDCGEMIHPALLECPVCGHKFPPRETDLGDAQNGGILAGERTYEEREVLYVDYEAHEKRGAKPEEHRPRTLQVTYFFDEMGRDTVREWLCPEHPPGFAHRKYLDWWRRHVPKDMPPPDDAAEAARLCRSGAIRPTKGVTVERIAGEKFPRVIAYVLGDLPPPPKQDELPMREPGDDTAEIGVWQADDYDDPLDDLPF